MSDSVNQESVEVEQTPIETEQTGVTTENLYTQTAAEAQQTSSDQLHETVDISENPSKLYEEPTAAEETVLQDVDYNLDDVETTAPVTERDRSLVRSIGKSLGLTNEQARKLLSDGTAIIAKERAQERKEILAQWSNEILNDKEIGGVNFSKTRNNLYRVMKNYGGQDVLDVLNATGLGSHPAIVRMFNRIGNALSEDNNFVRGQPAPKKVNPLDLIYDNSPNLS